MPMRKLRRIHFLHHRAPAWLVDELPPSVDECHAFDFWFEFEDECLAFLHEEASFFRCGAPPAGAELIPTTEDEAEGGCMPLSFCGASLTGIFEESEQEFMLLFDNGGIIELEREYGSMTDGPQNPWLSPTFYSPTRLASEDCAAERACFDEEAARDRRVSVQEQPEVPAPGAAADLPPWQQLPRAQVSDFVRVVSPREQAQLQAGLWDEEWVCWATRPQAKFWSGDTISALLVGLALLAYVGYGTCVAIALCGTLGNILASFLPFFCLAILCLARPWWSLHRQKRTLYVVTNQRAIVIRPGLFSRKWQWWLLTPRLYVVCERMRGKPGNIIFCKYRPVSRKAFATLEGLTAGSQRGFLNIHNIERAQKELRAVVNANRGR